MKGVVLAGGMGTRLWPLTKVTNKCLLPVYNKPMIFYPIQTFVESGIDDILLVCGGNAVGEFLRILGNGEDFGLKHLHYTVQKEANGIADALGLAEEWSKREPVAVILADNIFEKPLANEISEFAANPEGARIFVTPVCHPEHYGVVELENDGPLVEGMWQTKVISIEEKPKVPKSNFIATGLYLYDSSVWDVVKTLKPSARRELEITDVNKYYLGINKLKAHPIDGYWCDCGESFDTYTEAFLKVRELWSPKCCCKK